MRGNVSQLYQFILVQACVLVKISKNLVLGFEIQIHCINGGIQSTPV